MTLKEQIKQHKLNNNTYLVLHNNANKRFFGDFIYSDRLNDYLELKCSEIVKFSKYIYIATLPEYTDSLGVDSLKFKKEQYEHTVSTMRNHYKDSEGKGKTTKTTKKKKSK